MYAPLLRSIRGEYRGEPCVETEHQGAIVVLDGSGNIIFSLGDPFLPVHLRSVAKPFQLLPFLLHGLHRSKWKDDFSIEMSDLALMMSSHSGEEFHVERIAKLLEAGNLTSDLLRCGVHPPYNEVARQKLVQTGATPTVLHNNCSGKHTAMLMTNRARGLSLFDYLQLEHPLQQEIIGIMLAISSQKAENLGFGIDGCSLPTFIMPFHSVAILYAALASPKDSSVAQNSTCSLALSMLFKAGTKHPEYIGGTKRLDTLLMQAAPGKVFAKTGADGVFAMATAASERFPKGLGIMIKVADGDSNQKIRAITTTILLTALGYLAEDPTSWPIELQKMATLDSKNYRGIKVGQYESLFALPR